MIYIPPDTKKPCDGIERFLDLSFKRQIMSANDIEGDDPPTVRILHFHGNSQDITTTRVMVKDVMNEISLFLPPTYYHIECWTVDYPGYSSHGKRELLGSKELDDQIENLWVTLLSTVGKKGGLNIIWSYSIGTRYAAQLYSRRYEVDLLFCQAPYYNFPESYSGFGSGFYPPPRGSGVDVITQGRERGKVFFYMAELDETFPPGLSLSLLKTKCTQYVVELGAKHGFFVTLRASQTTGCYIGDFVEKNIKISDNIWSDIPIALIGST